MDGTADFVDDTVGALAELVDFLEFLEFAVLLHIINYI